MSVVVPRPYHEGGVALGAWRFLRGVAFYEGAWLGEGVSRGPRRLGDVTCWDFWGRRAGIVLGLRSGLEVGLGLGEDRDWDQVWDWD